MIVKIVSYSEELPRTLDLCYATYDSDYVTFEDMDGKPYKVKPDDLLAILIPKNTFLDDNSLYAIAEIFDVREELKHEGRHTFSFNVEE